MSHLIISCFAGTGMNYAIDKLKDKYSIDKIDKLKDFYIKYPTVDKYQKDVISRSEKHDILFIPYFLHMEDRFLKHKVNYYMIYPDKSCKEEYLKRFKDLNFTEEQINNFKNNWNEMINDCSKHKDSIKLNKDEYALDKIIALLGENNMNEEMVLDESSNSNYRVQYTNYVIDHIANVKKGYFWIKENCPEMLEKCDKKKVENNLIVHDESKWSTEEFEPYALYFYGPERTEKVKADFDKAWKHHYLNNKHHPEWWKGLPMSEEYIVEMICDWWSFSWRSGNLGEIFDFWEKNRNGKFNKVPEVVVYRVQHLLNMLHKKLQLLDLI